MKKILAALITLGSVGTHAATISYNFGLPLTLTTTEITQTGALNFFDPALGMLTGAALTIEGSASFQFSGTNNASQTRSANLTSFTTLAWSSSLSALNAFLPSSPGGIELSASSGNQNYAVGQTRTFGPLTDLEVQTDDLSTILGSLQQGGGGTFDLTCESDSGLLVRGGGGNINTTQSTQAGCGATIVYTYDAAVALVPEPASLALIGIGLAGLGVARRRKS